MSEGREIMAVTPVNPLKIYKVLGSFSEKKHLKSIELEDEYYVKCVHLGSDGSIKVGIVLDPDKKKFLKENFSESVQEESIQVSLGDLPKEPKNSVADESVVSEPEDVPVEGLPEEEDRDTGDIPSFDGLVEFSENALIVHKDTFFDELHVFSEFKHAFSNIYYLNPACCGKAFTVVNSRKEILCSYCGRTYPATGWCKPKPSITF